MSAADDEVRAVCAEIDGLMDALNGNVTALTALLTADPDAEAEATT